MSEYINTIVNSIVEHFFKDKIRRGSIQAVKGYITGVKYARLTLLGLFAIGAVSAVFMSGLVLTIIGIVTLLPLNLTAMSVILLCIGLLMSLVTGVGLYLAFSQKRWMEMSKAYQLMDAVLAPWPGNLPPNPLDILRPQSPSAPASHETAAQPDVEAPTTKATQAERRAQAEEDANDPYLTRNVYAREAQLATPLA